MAKKGENLSEETKKKMSESKRIGFAEGRIKPTAYWQDKELSQKHKEKISKSLVGNQRCLGKRWIVQHRRNPNKVEDTRIRKSPEYKLWRTSVFERDNYTCQTCGQRDSSYLVADHILPFGAFPKERFNLSNGKTLCLKCHYKTDTFGWGGYRIKMAIANT